VGVRPARQASSPAEVSFVITFIVLISVGEIFLRCRPPERYS
jgi:hypothetical protein